MTDSQARRYTHARPTHSKDAGDRIASMTRTLSKLFANRTALAIAAIFLTGLLTYATGIARLGYYYDDWYLLWSAAARGAGSLVNLFSMDRPFMGWIYTATYRILGDSLWAWHLYALAWRIAGAVAFYWILDLLWPKLKNTLVLAAILFIVYPGFLSLPDAATKVNHLTGFGAALFSIAFSLQAIKTPKRAWVFTVLAMLSTAFYLWIYEYMIGLEAMRVLLMFWMHWQGKRKQAQLAAKETTWAYLPYLLVAAIFLIWRLFLFDSTRVATDLEGILGSYRANLRGMISRLIFQSIRDFLATTVFAWGVQPYRLFSLSTNRDIGMALLLAAGVALLALGVLRAMRKAQADAEDAPSYALVTTGALIALATVIPVVATIRSLDLLDAYKSYGLHPSPGVIILVIGLASMLKPRFRHAALIGLIALSVAAQSLNTQMWARQWDIQRNFWWQLTWRAPDLDDNTMLMAYAPDGFSFQQDYEVWAPVNLIYNPDTASSPPIQSEVLNSETALYILRADERLFAVRDIEVTQDYGNLLLASQPTVNSCVHFIDGQMPAYSVNERLIVQQVGQYSSLDRILTSGTTPTPPAAIFGQEPEHGWCYYFQQASLARQMGDWARIVELYEATVTAGLEPNDHSEYFVFFEGLVNTGRDGMVQEILSRGLSQDLALMYSFCQSLIAAPQYPQSFGYRMDDMKRVVCGIEIDG